MTADATRSREEEFERLLGQLARAPERPLDDGVTELGQYRLLGKIGQGGMGSVWSAEDRKLGRTIAIKRIAGAALADDTARRRLLQEARVASRLNHPNVVTIHAVEEVDGVDFIVMELVDGEPLSARIARGPLPLAEVVDLGAQIAAALACAHDAGLVHRDVKPQNVMVTRRGLVKVLDFGVARPSEPLTGLAPITAVGAIVGTVPYMAPEQLRGEPLDGRVDLFALGCVLYEMATGRRAFAAVDLPSSIHQITQVEPPAPSRVVAGLPEAFDRVVQRALAKDRERRYARAVEVAEALRSLVEPAGVAPPARPAAIVEGEPLLVGREAELAAVEALLAQAAAGRGALALVTGEAGIGKSALVDAALRRARAAGFATGRGACVGQLSAGEAWLSIVHALGDLVGGRDGALAREAIRSLAPSWAAQIPSLLTSGAEPVVANKGRMLLELGEVIGGLSARVPVVLVLEDLHWADPSTVDALRHLAPGLAGRRALVLATARAGEIDAAGHPLRAAFAEWRGRHAVHELPLGDLPVEGVARWIDARFGPNDFDRRLAQAVHERTEGHPLSVAAMLDVLSAPGPGGARPRIFRDGRDGRDGGVWHASVDGAALEVPASLLGVLQARLEGLHEDERALLAAAAVQGTELLASVLAEALAIDELDVEDRLALIARTHRLVKRVADEELPDDSVTSRWRLAHALYQDVLYGALAPARRAALHRRTAEALLRRYRGEEARVAAALGAHFERARDFARAAQHLMAAGDNAIALFASVEAEGHFQRARACAERLAGEERTRTLCAVHQRLAGALVARGAYDGSARALGEAMACARSLGDEDLLGEIHVALGDTFTVGHRLVEARREVEAALRIAAARGQAELAARARLGLATMDIIVGDLDGSVAALEAIPGPPTPLALHLRGLIDYLRGDYADAEARIFAAIAGEAQLPDIYWRTEVRMFHGLALAGGGRVGEALRVLGVAFEMARRSESQVNLGRIGNSIGWLRRELGMDAQAVEFDERAVEAGRVSGESEAEAQALVNLIEGWVERGERGRVDEAFARVAELARGDDWMRWRYLIRADAARARRAVADLDPEADAAVARLAESASRHGARKYQAMAALLFARLRQGRGDLDGAWQSVGEARAILARHPAPLVGWKLEACAASVARARGDLDAERAATAAAEALVARIAADLGEPERSALAARAASVLRHSP